MDPSEALNNLKFQRFRTRARAAKIAEVHVSRVDRRDHVLLRYNGRDPKKGVINGEWTIAKRTRTAEEVEAAVEEFVGKIGGEFRLKKRNLGNGDGEASADAPEKKADAPEKKPAEKKPAKKAAKKKSAKKKKSAAKK